MSAILAPGTRLSIFLLMEVLTFESLILTDLEVCFALPKTSFCAHSRAPLLRVGLVLVGTLERCHEGHDFGVVHQDKGACVAVAPGGVKLLKKLVFSEKALLAETIVTVAASRRLWNGVWSLIVLNKSIIKKRKDLLLLKFLVIFAGKMCGLPQKIPTEMIIPRQNYVDLLAAGRGNGLVKIVTGGRRCGKSFLLFNLFHRF